MVVQPLRPGQPAPDFDVLASDGRRVALRDFRGRRALILYFYPKDFTIVCTAETCGFRELYEEVKALRAEVVGVSMDTDESHRRFAEAHGIPFPLISDRDGTLTRLYGASGRVRSMLRLPKRLTFVIDDAGIITRVVEAELSARPHLEGAREAIERLAGA